jgi:hypothetical protein
MLRDVDGVQRALLAAYTQKAMTSKALMPAANAATFPNVAVALCSSLKLVIAAKTHAFNNKQQFTVELSSACL